jgi:hypothetical protein
MKERRPFDARLLPANYKTPAGSSLERWQRRSPCRPITSPSTARRLF